MESTRVMMGLILAILISIKSLATIKIETVNLMDIPKAEKIKGLLEEEQRKKLKTVKDNLEKAALYRSLGGFEQCILSARGVSGLSLVYDRALQLEMDCAAQWMMDNASKSKITDRIYSMVNETIKRAENYAQKSNRSGQTDNIYSIQKALRLSLAKWLASYAMWKPLRVVLVDLFREEANYSRTDRGQIYLLSGDLLVVDRDWLNAYHHFERARLFGADIEARQRNVAPILSAKLQEETKYRYFTEGEKGAGGGGGGVGMSLEEEELYNQAKAYLNREDPESINALAKLMRKFPSGVQNKWAQDKLFDMFLVEIEKSRASDSVTENKKKIQKELLTFDADRLQSWGKSLFANQAYGEAAEIYQRAAELTALSTKAATSFYMAARSYQLSGKYSEAEKYFKTLVIQYPGAQEFVDAVIQWGLINLNQGNISDGIIHLETARTRGLTTHQDLTILYWLYQTYKKKNAKDYVAKTAAEIVSRYPLSYYGLVVAEETEGHLPVFDKGLPKKGKTFFSNAEKKAIERSKALLASGLSQWALEELRPIEERALLADEALYLLNFYIQGMNYQKVFKFLGGVSESIPETKSAYYVKQLFPKEYWDLLDDSDLNSGLDPFLLISIMRQESAFNYEAVSSSGAVGLLQMLPSTADEVKKELGVNGVKIPRDLNIPEINIRFCAYYFSKQLKKFNGSVPLALAAYNAGPSRIATFLKAQGGTMRPTWLDELPFGETSYYVKSIIKNYILYRMIYGDLKRLPNPPWSNPDAEKE